MDNKKLYSFTFISNLAKLILNIVIGIITVPISIEYWKSEKYGIWLLINSVLVYLTASNLGLNAASSILMNKEKSVSKKIDIFKKSFIIVSITTFILISCFLVLNSTYTNWVLILGKIDSSLLGEAQKACFILMLFFLINIPFSLFASAINGFHKVYFQNLLAIINCLFLFLALLLNIRLTGNLVLFATLIGCTNLFTNFIRAAFFYFNIYKKSISMPNEETNGDSYSYKTILRLGLRCFSGSIASMIVLNTDNLVISHFLGVEHVPYYAVTFKLFTILFNLIFMINSSLVPVLGRMISKGEYKKSNEIYRITFHIIVFIGGGIFLGSLSFFKTLIFNWSGEAGYAGTGALIFLGAYAYIFCVVNLNYIIINTFDYIKGSMWIVWGEAVVNISVSIMLSSKLGLTGIALGTFLGTLIFPSIFFPIIIKRKSLNRIIFDHIFFFKHVLLVLIFSIFAYMLHIRDLSFTNNLVSTIILLLLYSFFTYFIHGKEDRGTVNQFVLRKIKKGRK